MKKMNIGIAREIAARGKEIRVALLPREVRKIVEAGYRVLAEADLGSRLGVPDSEYIKAGAIVTGRRQLVFRQDILVKLKPPLPQEFLLLHKNILFSMLHAEQNPHYLKMLKRAGAVAIAMELVKNRAGERLIQCTDIAGEQGMIMAFHLARKSPSECKVLVLGYGAIASGAMNVAFSLGAKVRILRKTEFKHIRYFLRNVDILVGAVAWPKEERQKRHYLVSRQMLKLMDKNAIVLDLSVDFPNIIQTCRPTLIDQPVYEIDGIRHISIYGYPGLAPISSSLRYSRQILPVLLKIAQAKGIQALPAYLKKAVINPDNFI
jgi:alanine dehydrogenase